MEPGKIVFLNGTSSSGKTLISQALQEILDGYPLHTGIDHYLLRIPVRFHVDYCGDDIPTADGFLWLVDQNKRVKEIRVGPCGLRIMAGMYQAYAAYARAGNPLIIDDVVFDRQVLREAVKALAGLEVLFVAVRCPYEILMQREHDRGDRDQGLVEAHFHLVHVHGKYDFEVDTSKATPEECARQIRDRLLNGPKPAAFTELYHQFSLNSA